MSELRRFVAYFRVSTAQQGRSGLGLDAQRSAVSSFLAGQHSTRVIAEYIEVESGRRKDRRQLLLAINHARATKSSLIIAKLDRLARNVSFTSALMESGVEFVCCDMPSANKFTIHIMSALAEMEAEMISARTKAALIEAKKRGVTLGNPRLAECRGDPAAARAAWVEQVDRHAKSYLGLLLEAEELGRTTLQSKADFLNERGALTQAGNRWRSGSVHRLQKRLGLER